MALIVRVLTFTGYWIKCGSGLSQTQTQKKSPNAVQASQANSPSGTQYIVANSPSASQNILNSPAGIQTPINIARDSGPLTIYNNYYVPDSAAKTLLADLERRVTSTETNVNITRNELLTWIRALKDIDQRTAGLGLLPDGRTRYVSIIGGSPTVVMDETTAAIGNVLAGNVEAAFVHSTNSVAVYEQTKSIETNKDIFQAAGVILPDSVFAIYRRAGEIAYYLSITKRDDARLELAHAYLKKAFDVSNAVDVAVGWLTLTLFPVDMRRQQTSLRELIRTISITRNI